MAGADAGSVSDCKLISEMLEDMRTVARAIQNHGYKLYNYRFRPAGDDRPQAWDEDDPEPAFKEFLEKLQNPDEFYRETGHIEAGIDREVIGNLITNYTEDDWENAVNEILRQINGEIEMGEQERAERHPLHHEVDIVYRLNTHRNYFEIANLDGSKGEEFAKEVAVILQDKEFEVRRKY